MFVILGIILLVTGAILRWAVETSADGVDLQMIGLILMAGGALSLLAGAIGAAGWWRMGSRRFATERHVSADGQHVYEETRAE